MTIAQATPRRGRLHHLVATLLLVGVAASPFAEASAFANASADRRSFSGGWSADKSAATLVSAQSTSATASADKSAVRVRVQTELGDIVVEVDPVRAPVTAANFLKYVDAGHFNGGVFHRTVKMDNQPESTIKIEVIQAGVNPDRAKDGFGPIVLERTSVSGIAHKDGVVSMARGTPDSATSGWFICINDQASLDFGGMRNPDGQGFGAFGRVVSGMDVVRKIQAAPSSTNRTTNTEAQRLTPAVKILKVARVP